MNCFVDTNVPIAFIFRIDPLNHYANSVFKFYDSIFWSHRVKNECEKVFDQKLNLLNVFYKNLLKDLNNNLFNELHSNEFSFENLIGYLKKKEHNKKQFKNIESSLNIFWDKYVNETFPSFENFKTAITLCLQDLKFQSFKRKKYWKKNVIYTEKRIEKYDHLRLILQNLGVHHPDDEIILDAHDYNLKTSFNLDFVTFDKKCYNYLHKQLEQEV